MRGPTTRPLTEELLDRTELLMSDHTAAASVEVGAPGVGEPLTRPEREALVERVVTKNVGWRRGEFVGVPDWTALPDPFITTSAPLPTHALVTSDDQ